MLHTSFVLALRISAITLIVCAPVTLSAFKKNCMRSRSALNFFKAKILLNTSQTKLPAVRSNCRTLASIRISPNLYGLFKRIEENNFSFDCSLTRLDNVRSIMDLPGLNFFIPALLASEIGTPQFFSEYFLKNKISWEQDLGDGLRPLHYAAWGGNNDVIQYLLQQRCDPNIRSGDRDSQTGLHARDFYVSPALCGESPLHFAQCASTVSLLVDNGGADISLRNRGGQTAIISVLKAMHFRATMQEKEAEEAAEMNTLGEEIRFIKQDYREKAYLVSKTLVAYGANPHDRNNTQNESATDFAHKYQFYQCEDLFFSVRS